METQEEPPCVAPVYAALASWYVLVAWLPQRLRDWTLVSAIIALSADKAFSAAWRAVFPSSAFHPGMAPSDSARDPR
jgi:hypothetical protein